MSSPGRERNSLGLKKKKRTASTHDLWFDSPCVFDLSLLSFSLFSFSSPFLFTPALCRRNSTKHRVLSELCSFVPAVIKSAGESHVLPVTDKLRPKQLRWKRSGYIAGNIHFSLFTLWNSFWHVFVCSFLCLIPHCANCINLLPNWSYVWGGGKCQCMRDWITNNKPYIPGNDGGPSISGEELERPLLGTSGPFDHLPHCQVPPVECFIISPSKCLRLAKSTEVLLCTTRCHSGLLGSTGGQQGFREIINRDG